MGAGAAADVEVKEFTSVEPREAWDEYRQSGMRELLGAYNLCQALFALESEGLAERLRRGVNGEELVEGLDPHFCGHLLNYLRVRGVLESVPGGYRLSGRGRRLLADVPMAQLGFYVEAYGPVVGRIGDLLSNRASYGEDVLRDGEALGRHCATLFDVFHNEIVLDALRQVGADCVLDLGCGAGRFIIDACREYPGMRGIGLDISGEAIELARRLAAEAGVDDRARFVVADAFRPESWPELCHQADALFGVGVLHEHFRSGEQAVIDILDTFAGLLRRGRLKSFILGEPELYYDDEENDDDLYLVHIFTLQGFPRRWELWLDLFEKTDLRCRRLLRRPGAGPRFAFYDLVPR
jgi:SAM-dependent methyltransferase